MHQIYVILYIDISSLNYLAVHVEFTLKACEMYGVYKKEEV